MFTFLFLLQHIDSASKVTVGGDSKENLIQSQVLWKQFIFCQNTNTKSILPPIKVEAENTTVFVKIYEV
jgi:hypothetical protein